MSYRLLDVAIDTVGVVGSGNIGPDIALHLAKALLPFDVHVVVVDVAPDALERGKAKLTQKVAKGRESGAFDESTASALASNVCFTTDYSALRNAGLIIEAATEDLEIKRRIFAQLESLCAPNAVLASNSSHIEPERIFGDLAHRERTAVIHYFFPAERNPLVEIVSGKDTARELADALVRMYEALGKVPVRVGGRYGYAVNPVFEGLFLAAALCVESGLGSVKEVDIAAKRALGLGIGPFTAMNLTGGNPITDHALDEMMIHIGPWFRSPKLMKTAMARGEPWPVAQRDEVVTISPDREHAIADAMQGAYFGLVGEIVDSGIITMSDMELAVEIGLAVRAPFAMMNDVGVPQAMELVRRYAAGHPGFVIPRCIARQARSGEPFRIEYVFRRNVGEVAVVTIRRPQVLNALNDDVYQQLYDRFAEIRDDRGSVGAVLTGFGTKAFVSGADVKFLAGITSPAQGVETSERSKQTGNLIENLGKPVICALNGMALGGGSELAMCCTARIARKGLAIAMGQPEANLGIVPGAGATQRLPRLVGFETAARMLRTGRALSSADAVACGLVREEVEGDVVDAAITLARDAAAGRAKLDHMSTAAVMPPDQLPSVELGHLSAAIDGLICRAITEGCRKPLADGLRFESEMFGQCCATEDMRIGVKNFFDNGPRVKAKFVNR